MKITICIRNYVDNVELFVDGAEIHIEKLNLLSKAQFECDVEQGIHEIVVAKKMGILEHNWKKGIALDWISCLLGVPDWTLKEKTLDTKACSIHLRVDVKCDEYINLELTQSGFKLVENASVLYAESQVETSKIARKRIRNAYMIPALLLATIIEVLLLAACIFLLVNRQYSLSIIVFALSALWVWLICRMLFKKKRHNY